MIAYDVVIPCIRKDLRTLPYVVDSIRRNVVGKVGGFFLLSPDDPEIRSFCHDAGLVWTDESTFLPIRKQDIKYAPRGQDRSGWIFQQLLKLGADGLGQEKFVLVTDADTVYLRKQSFLKGSRIVLDYNREIHRPYRDNLHVLLPGLAFGKKSYVCNHLFAKKEWLRQIRLSIETEKGCSWFKAILDNLDQQELSSFSEYELFGHYAHSNLKDDVVEEHFRGIGMSYETFRRKLWKVKLFSLYFKTLSMHMHE